MDDRRSALVDAARWLKAERRRLGASARLVASLATLLAQRQGDPVKIYQQQISDLENADGSRGPRTLRPWFRHVRAAFESGLVADALGFPGEASSYPDLAGPTAPVREGGQDFEIRDSDGRLVGRLTLYGAPPA